MRWARVTKEISDAGRSVCAGLANIGTARASSRRRSRTILQPRAARPGTSRCRLPRLVALVVAVSSVAAPARAALPVGRDHRLILGFIEDGSIVGTGWFEAGFSAADSGDGWDYRGTTLVALRYGRDVEAGFSLGGLHRERHDEAPLYGGTVEESFSRNGWDDALVYGKYRVLRGTVDLALGASASFPLEGDGSGLTSGAVEVRGFVGARGALPGGAALIGHAGFATAGSSGYSGAPGGTALRAGVGSLIPLARIWTLILEAEYEGGLYAGQESGTAALAGLDWRPTENIAVRGGVGGGWGRAAEVSGILSAVFRY
jgi:hypothetical protein